MKAVFSQTRPLFLFLLIMLQIGALAACGGSGPSETKENGPSVKTISPEAAYERIQSGDPVVIVDVRTREEYDAGHIEGALLIPNETIGSEPPEQLPDPDAELLLYCRSGNRSAQAAKKLIDLGYTNVSDFGGINQWPYETVR